MTTVIESTRPLAPPEEPAVRGLSLGARLFLATASLLTLALGLAVAFSSRQAQRVAEQKIVQNLKSVPAVFSSYVDGQAAARRGQVRSLSEEPGTKALLGESGANPETFHDSARDFAKSLGADLVFLFDDKGLLITRSDREAGEETGRDFSQVSWVKTALITRTEASAFILDVRRTRTLYLVAAAPVVQGAGAESKLNGVLAAGFPMNRERARELSGMTSGEVAFLASLVPRRATPLPEVVAATEGLDVRNLLGQIPEGGALATAISVRGEAYGPVEFPLRGEPFIGTALPIFSGGGEPIGALLVARSKQAEMAAFQEIRRGLLLVGAVALVLSLPVCFALAQGLSRPIRQLAQGAQEIGRGQLDVVLPSAGGEVGTLARAFAVMVSELKAKSALEAMITELQRRPGDITFPGTPAGDGDSGSRIGLDVGRVFAGRYEILSVLGEGGMGTVFRVRDRELDDQVALKALKAPQGGTDAGAEALRHEIKLARMITHANVVRVHDFAEFDGIRFFTMEYVPGTTLRELLGPHRGLDLTPALQIAKQICRGLAAVHKVGIIHGDLKPQNVMVMGSGVVKLMDFGVARFQSALRPPGTALAGTPLYMSPEQARGAELDERCDIYSAGVVMFEIFTGHCPFTAPDMYEIMQMHLTQAPPNPRGFRPEMPESLAQIILTCLDKSRIHRPASAADLDRLLMRVRV